MSFRSADNVNEIEIAALSEVDGGKKVHKSSSVQDHDCAALSKCVQAAHAVELEEGSNLLLTRLLLQEAVLPANRTRLLRGY